MPREREEKSGRSQEDRSQEAYQGLRRMLYSKELVPGQKIAYRELAERLQTEPDAHHSGPQMA